MEIAVYCGSSNRVPQEFFRLATEFGEQLGRAGHTLLYGGGNVGLMGSTARGVHAAGGRVVGVIPDALRDIEGIAYELADELIVTATMQQRKRLLFSRADAFVALPGGLGTLEELAEVATLRKLGYLPEDTPIFLLNGHGYYDALLGFLEHASDTGFAGPADSLFTVADSSAAIFSALSPA